MRFGSLNGRTPITNIAAFLAVPVGRRRRVVRVFLFDLGQSESDGARTVRIPARRPSYIVRGLIGLLVDQQFGVLTTAPIYLLAIAGMSRCSGGVRASPSS